MRTTSKGMWTRCAGAAAMVILLGSAEGVAGAAPLERLAWTQEGPAQTMRFKVFVDGVSSMLGDVSCVPGPAASECVATLPELAPGLHWIMLSAIDALGNESALSQSLSVVIAGTPGPTPNPTPIPTPSPHSSAPSAVGSALSSGPSVSESAQADALRSGVCGGPNCYAVSIVAHGQGSITRLESLTDDRVLMLRDGSDVLLMRSGAVATAYQLARDDPGASAIADIAVDPDFANNRFVYLAVVSASSASARVRVVRVREVADRLAEAATIVPDLPFAGDVMPRLSMTADRRVYLAIPAAPAGAARQSYDGLILAFTDDGRSAGSAAGSPVLARGPQQPAALQSSPGWMWAASLDDAGDGRLQLLKLSADGVLTATREMESGTAQSRAGVLDLAFTRPDRGLLIAASPQSLFAFRLSPDATVLATERIDLGAFEPTALSTMPSGGIVVAARDATDPGMVVILSLSPLNDARH